MVVAFCKLSMNILLLVVIQYLMVIDRKMAWVGIVYHQSVRTPAPINEKYGGKLKQSRKEDIKIS